jgi:hypothetical protein
MATQKQTDRVRVLKKLRLPHQNSEELHFHQPRVADSQGNHTEAKQEAANPETRNPQLGHQQIRLAASSKQPICETARDRRPK